MGIKTLTLADWEQSQESEEWTPTDSQTPIREIIDQIAMEVHGFGLEVELYHDELAYLYHWRIVAVKTEPDDPYAGTIDETGKVETVVGTFKSPEIKWPLSDWRYEVANADTELGYDDWLEHRIEAESESSSKSDEKALVEVIRLIDEADQRLNDARNIATLQLSGRNWELVAE